MVPNVWRTSVTKHDSEDEERLIQSLSYHSYYTMKHPSKEKNIRMNKIKIILLSPGQLHKSLLILMKWRNTFGLTDDDTDYM